MQDEPSTSAMEIVSLRTPEAVPSFADKNTPTKSEIESFPDSDKVHPGISQDMGTYRLPIQPKNTNSDLSVLTEQLTPSKSKYMMTNNEFTDEVEEDLDSITPKHYAISSTGKDTTPFLEASAPVLRMKDSDALEKSISLGKSLPKALSNADIIDDITERINFRGDSIKAASFDLKLLQQDFNSTRISDQQSALNMDDDHNENILMQFKVHPEAQDNASTVPVIQAHQLENHVSQTSSETASAKHNNDSNQASTQDSISNPQEKPKRNYAISMSLFPEEDPEYPLVPKDRVKLFFELINAYFPRFLEKIPRRSNYRLLREACNDVIASAKSYPKALKRLTFGVFKVFWIVNDKMNKQTVAALDNEVVMEVINILNKFFQYGFVGQKKSFAAGGLSIDHDEEDLEKLVTFVCKAYETNDEQIHMHAVQCLLSAIKDVEIGIHGQLLLTTIRCMYSVFLNARSPSTHLTARTSLTYVMGLVFENIDDNPNSKKSILVIDQERDSLTRSSSSGATSDGSSSEEKTALFDDPSKLAAQDKEHLIKVQEKPPNVGSASEEFSNVRSRDAYLVFRALCALGSKDLGQDPIEEYSHDEKLLHSKQFALELLLDIIKDPKAGLSLTKDMRFVYALRSYFVPTVMSCSLSSNMDIVSTSFELFEVLLLRNHFRPVFKKEIQTIFRMIIFRFLDSAHSGFARKSLVLKLLKAISTNQQALCELFVNYDCDINSDNLFENIMVSMSSIARKSIVIEQTDISLNYFQFSSSVKDSEKKGLENGMELKLSALTSVVSIVCLLRDWAKPLEKFRRERLSNITEDKHDKATQDDNADHDKPASKSSQPTRDQEPNGNQFQDMKMQKKIIETAVEKFNKKPKRGIEYLVEVGYIDGTPESVAKILDKNEGIQGFDATLIGEYLGDPDEFNVSVLETYASLNDFTNLTFDEAIRLFLRDFRLPGEAQKIDRIMERFASSYFLCNPDVFASADVAYVLGYSVIMLNTDAHNPQVKTKMTKNDFLKNNRGINDGQDLDPEFLGGIYDRITANQIKLKDTISDSKRDAAMSQSYSQLSKNERDQMFTKETHKLLSEVRDAFKRTNKDLGESNYVYYTAANSYHSKMMFESFWEPVLAALSVVLQDATDDDSELLGSCLKGFRNAISLASTFNLAVPRESFVNALAKFTNLSNLQNMRVKNVECIRILIGIASLEGESLGEQWAVILRAISYLMQLKSYFASDTNSFSLSSRHKQNGPLDFLDNGERILNQASPKLSKKESESALKMKKEKLYNIQATKTASLIPDEDIDVVFKNSVHLSSYSVVDLMKGLIDVSLEELTESPPKIYCLQKVIEVAYYNINERTRIEWTRMWDLLGNYFSKLLRWDLPSVIKYGLLCLNQLVSRLFEKEEPSNFAFQKAVLKPYLDCFISNKSVDIRETVLKTLSQLLIVRLDNLRSGWRTIFQVLARAPEDDNDHRIVNLGFQILESIVRNHFGKIDFIFVDGVNCISAYTASSSVDMAIAALDLLSDTCTELILSGNANSTAKPIQRKPSKSLSDIGFTEEMEGHMQVWFPVLLGTANAINDPREEVKTAAMHSLFGTLKNCGGSFSSGLWSLIFRGVLNQIFDDIKYVPVVKRDNVQGTVSEEWATTTGSGALQLLIGAVMLHYDQTRHLLKELLSLVRNWIVQGGDSVSRGGLDALEELFHTGAQLFTEEEWNIIVDFVQELFIVTTPNEVYQILENAKNLGDDESFKQLSFKDVDDTSSPALVAELTIKEGNGEFGVINKREFFQLVRSKCIAQLLLVDEVQSLIERNYSLLSSDVISPLMKAVHTSYVFAKVFNENKELRIALWKADFMKQVPNLVKQETHGLVTCLNINFWIFADPSKCSTNQSAIGHQLFDSYKDVFHRYFKSAEPNVNLRTEDVREINVYGPVIKCILSHFSQMSTEHFREHGPSFYETFLQLTQVDDEDVRKMTLNILKNRIGGLLGLETNYVPSLQLPETVSNQNPENVIHPDSVTIQDL